MKVAFFLLIFLFLGTSCRQKPEAGADNKPTEEGQANRGISSQALGEEETSVAKALSEFKVYDPNRWPLDRAVDHHIALALMESGREEMLEFHLRDGLWTSILDLDRYLKQDRLDPRTAEFAESTLETIAAYFKKKPMEPVKPEDLQLAKKIEENSRERAKDLEGQEGAGEVEKELQQGFQQLGGVFELIEEAGQFYQAARYARYLETKAIVDRINAAE